MDQATLVNDQVEDGKKVVAELLRSGFPVAAACWIKSSEEGSQWTLYIASPAADKGKEAKARQKIHPVIWHLPPPNCVHPSDISLIGARAPLAKAVIEARERHPGKYPAWVHDFRLGPLGIDGAYIYPAISLPDSAGTPAELAAQNQS